MENNKHYSTVLLAVSTAILVFAGCKSSVDSEEETTVPVITDIKPESGRHGTEVTLQGTNFGETAAQNTVTFDSTEAEILQASPTSIVVSVPKYLNDGQVLVRVATDRGTSSVAGFVYIQTITVSTYAGTGTFGHRDGDASTAQFREPAGLALGEDGTLLVADQRGHTIRAISPDGQVGTLAGLDSSSGFQDGEGSEARFDTPTGITIDNSGIIYIADLGNSRIRRLDSEGTVITLAGSTYGYSDGVGENAQFYTPFSLALDGEGSLFVSDHENNRIRKVTGEGNVSTYAGIAEPGFSNGYRDSAQFWAPRGIVLGKNDELFIIDSGNYRIRMIDKNGQVGNYAGDGTEGHKDGNADSAQFRIPMKLAIDAHGVLYVADYGNHCIRTITPDGEVTTLAGIPGEDGYVDGDETEAEFTLPSSIAVNGEGTEVYVGDIGNHVIRKITIE